MRCREYFNQLLNVINDNDNDDENIEENINESDEKPLSREELRSALNKMKNGKAPGKDMIPSIILKDFGDRGESWVLEIMNVVWETGNILED